MARIDCPFRDDGTFIQLPDEWLGEHSIRQYKAIEGLEGKDYPAHIHNFVVGMAMLDDWSIPGLTANPETWDVTKAPITVMVWMWSVIKASYEASFIIPKKNQVRY